MSVAPDWPLTPLTAPLLISKLTILFQSNYFTISILGDNLKAPCHSIPSLYMLKVYQYFINLLMITACLYGNPSFSSFQTQVKVKSSKAAFYFSNWNCIVSAPLQSRVFQLLQFSPNEYEEFVKVGAAPGGLRDGEQGEHRHEGQLWLRGLPIQGGEGDGASKWFIARYVEM